MSYSNEDLAPIPIERRTWGTLNYIALWISMSLCIPTYMLASSLIDGGMNWWQAILTVFLGNAIVLVPMILNGHAGATYGIPFPVFARASFGVRGANIPAVLRAIVACGWFGIQTWIGGYALFQMLKIWFPAIAELPQVFPPWMGLETGPALTFFVFWLVNLLVIYLGIESIRKLLIFKAIFLPAAALALLSWAIVAAKGLGPILSQPSKFNSAAAFWKFFFPGLTGMVGFWATVSLNIPDFTRYAKSQRAQVVGQALGLAPSMTAFAFVGVVVTSTWLIAYSSLLGPIGGILIVDYYFVRQKVLNVQALYQGHGSYWYQNGFNLSAVIALVAGILPNVPGFLTTINLVQPDVFPAWLNGLYHYAWFVGLFVGGGVYTLLVGKPIKLSDQ